MTSQVHLIWFLPLCKQWQSLALHTRITWIMLSFAPCSKLPNRPPSPTSIIPRDFALTLPLDIRRAWHLALTQLSIRDWISDGKSPPCRPSKMAPLLLTQVPGHVSPLMWWHAAKQTSRQTSRTIIEVAKEQRDAQRTATQSDMTCKSNCRFD